MLPIIIAGVALIVVLGSLMFMFPGDHDEHDQR